MFTQKKALVIIVLVFVLVLVGLYAMYRAMGENGVPFFGTEEEEGGNSPIFGNDLFGNGQTTTGENIGTGTGPVPKLRQISEGPVAGAVLFPQEEKTLIRFMERATGHIFETSTDSLTQTRISNTTIPRIEETKWSEDGTAVLVRYLNEIDILKTFYGDLSKKEGALEGWFLGNNMTNASVSAEGNLFYFEKIGTTANGILSNIDGTDAEELFSFPILDWSSYWVGSILYIATKPSHGILGYLYQVNTESGSLSKILSEEGLIALPSPNGEYVLFSTSENGGTTLFVYTLDSRSVTTVPFRTLADKCVWGSGSLVYCASPFTVEPGVYPDEWYQGLVSFSDDIWSYNVETNTETVLYDNEEEGRDFDSINLAVSDDGKYLLFTDKKTLTLWGLTL